MTNRVFWDVFEVAKIADRFFELYCAEPFEPLMTLVNRAQVDVLPVDRRRKCPSIKSFGLELCKKLGEKKAEVKRRLKQQAIPAAPAPEAEPLVIEVPAETPPVDKKKIVDEMTPGELIGAVVDRMGPSLTAVIAAISQKPIPHAFHSAPPAVHVPKLEIVHPPCEKRKRIIVVGLFPESERFVKDKISGFGNISVSFVDSNTKLIPHKICDHVVLMRRIVSHSQREQSVALHGKGRICYVEGGQVELLKKLADLNS